MNQAPTFPFLCPFFSHLFLSVFCVLFLSSFFEFALTRQKYLDIKLILAFKEVNIFGVYYC